MSIQRRDDWLTTPQGQALAGALVYYLLQPADVATLTPLATVYASTAAGAGVNPVTTDGYGHAVAYLDNSVLYTIVFVHPLLAEPLVLTDQCLSSGGAGGSTPFGEIPVGLIDGANLTFTLTVNPALLFLQYNQGVLVPGIGYTIAVVGGVTTLTLAIAPQIGDTLYASGLV